MTQNVKNRRGIYEYVLGGEKRKQLLDIRIFDDATKRKVYNNQTVKAKEFGLSNCPICAASEVGAIRSKIYAFKDMEADHVTPWSKGGATDMANCQMLCVIHNRQKGNK